MAPFAPNRYRIVNDLPDRIEPRAQGWLMHWTLRSPDSTQCAEVDGLLDEAGLLMRPGSLLRRACRPGDTLRFQDSWYFKKKREIVLDSTNEVEEGIRATYGKHGVSGDQGSNDRPLVYKPILYLYPTKPTHVRVDLDSSIDLVATHPTPQGRTWKVKAEPDGRLVDLSTNRSHHGLFWESRGWKAPPSDSGLVVPFAKFGAVLDSLLDRQGLDYRARGEFVTFWIARFHTSPYIAIRFENRTYAQAHPVHISPVPDSWLRVFAVFTPLSSPVARIPQHIVPPPTGRGFRAVEWGAQVESENPTELGMALPAASTPSKARPGMVLIPAGCFWMGSNDGAPYEQPIHQVCLDSFFMDNTEVTQSAFQRVMGFNPSHFTSCGDNCPVEDVSWNQAEEYCDRVAKRLPTEAQWEYAARAGTATKWHWGNDVWAAKEYAWFGFNPEQTHPVGAKKPNAWGLYDMSGNVAEWVSDWMGNYTPGLQKNPKGPITGEIKVIRGGRNESNAMQLGSADRSGMNPKSKAGLGFRCVM